MKHQPSQRNWSNAGTAEGGRSKPSCLYNTQTQFIQNLPNYNNFTPKER